MQELPTLITCPGVYHIMFLDRPHTPEEQAWFETTCRDVEACAKTGEMKRKLLPVLSTAIHLAADHLFVRYGKDAGWLKIDPDDIVEEFFWLSPTEMMFEGWTTCLASFYAFLIEGNRIDGLHGARIAQRLLASVGAWKPSRAERPYRADRRIPANAARRARSL